jgi:hypothetical protein
MLTRGERPLWEQLEFGQDGGDEIGLFAAEERLWKAMVPVAELCRGPSVSKNIRRVYREAEAILKRLSEALRGLEVTGEISSAPELERLMEAAGSNCKSVECRARSQRQHVA